MAPVLLHHGRDLHGRGLDLHPAGQGGGAILGQTRPQRPLRHDPGADRFRAGRSNGGQLSPVDERRPGITPTGLQGELGIDTDSVIRSWRDRQTEKEKEREEERERRMAFEYDVQRVSLCLRLQAFIIWLLPSKNAEDYGLEFACVYVVSWRRFCAISNLEVGGGGNRG